MHDSHVTIHHVLCHNTQATVPGVPWDSGPVPATAETGCTIRRSANSEKTGEEEVAIHTRGSGSAVYGVSTRLCSLRRTGSL